MADSDNFNDGDIIEGGAEYSPKSEFSKPAIVFQATQKVMEARAKEMRKGYFNTTVSKEGLPIRTWIEDSRKVYCSAVQALYDLLIPEILEDPSFDKDKKIIKRIGLLKKKYSYFVLEEKRIKGKIKWIKSKRSYMPEIDASVSIRKILPDGNEELIDIPSYWNKYINAYWNKMVDANSSLFRELIKIIHRKNYFKHKRSFGSY